VFLRFAGLHRLAAARAIARWMWWMPWLRWFATWRNDAIEWAWGLRAIR